MSANIYPEGMAALLGAPPPNGLPVFLNGYYAGHHAEWFSSGVVEVNIRAVLRAVVIQPRAGLGEALSGVEVLAVDPGEKDVATIRWVRIESEYDRESCSHILTVTLEDSPPPLKVAA